MTNAAALHSDLERDLALALTMADAADSISLKRFGASDLVVESKPDLTPVSDADLAVETAIRKILTTERPDDAVVGEEFGADLPTSGRRWVIDPIDGTKSFVRGVPVWATLIALFDDDEVVVGVVSAPALSRRWWAASGLGAHSSFQGQEPRPISVSGVRDLGDANLSFSELAEWETAGKLDTFLDLTRACWRVRGYGDFYSYMLVAEGAVDVALEPSLSLWDVAALVPIVTEAGGRLTEIGGPAISQTSTSALATNSHLHPAVLKAINS
ncbi:histidinol-phosphatase [Nakamurella antarctica]|uniref:Histidinol-phosphatase n=1 Tax=Nakamurella antarctica TaxID=1902245 RepID=A0A3G8ZLY8_9ACTN|nr:histidinol-phosphatase [Nakamurella antarctica]AZI58359.1 histidinol-phosphatase [Nakamurella antarctica]